MIKLRLQRKGRIRRPIYHIVVADSRAKRDGRIIEQVGRYDNVSEKKEVVLNEDRILYWLDTGAQPTDTVRSILRNEGILYKRHLIRWGKSEEEIAAAMNEWSEYRDSKKVAETSRKEQMKDVLATEEKEFKNQVTKKAAEAAQEIAEETEAAAEVAEAVDEVVADEATAEVEAPAEEAPADEAVAEETAGAEVAEEPAAEEVAEEAAPEAEEEVAEAPAEEAPAEEAVEEEVAEEPVAEEPVAEEAPAEEAPAEEPAAEATSSVSSDLSAKEAIDHIKATGLADLAGFVTDSETRKTVLAAWEAKQAE